LPFRHLQAFGSHGLADGVMADLMLNSFNAYEFDYGEGPGSIHALGIVYGTAAPFLLDDRAWRTYKLDLVMKRRGDPVGSTAASGNPYLAARSPLDSGAKRSDIHGLYHDSSIVALVKRGATFFACDNALRGLANAITIGYGISDALPEAVHAELRARLVPGTLLVPAGVAAINQAQEARFTFLPASV
jgi:intracellular sulfur oxidation DsrE/DsrF family protein